MLSEALIDQLKELCRQENDTLWKQGDLLVEAALNDEDMGKLAQILQLKAATLRDRERVSREFPANTRDTRHSWSVYRTLMRVSDAQDRRTILDARQEWTMEAMEIQVREWVKRQIGTDPSPVPHRTRSGMRLGNLRVIGQLVDGRLKLTIEAPATDLRTFEDGTEVTISAIIP